MKIDREDLLKILQTSTAGLTGDREVLEQSNCFVFQGGQLITFSGETLTRVESPLDVEGAVPAQDLLKLLGKLPDPEVEVTKRKGELVIKGQRRSAGITLHAEILLPYTDVPEPKGMRSIPENLMGVMQQAARICGKEEAQPRTTEVHITSSVVEATDNFRAFRCEMPTGFKQEALVPAASLKGVFAAPVVKAGMRGGWLHFEATTGHTISVRCSQGEYPDLAQLLKMKDPAQVTLPANLPDILARSEVMLDSHDKMVSITIEEGRMVLMARKETGWFKESKRVKYSGTPLKFDVNPQFLGEMLTKTRKVEIEANRMRLNAGAASFVVSLEVV